MNSEKLKKLKSAGWEVGSSADFLELTPQEVMLIELKLSLAKLLKKRRKAEKLSQKELARRIGSDQSRVSRMEAGDPSVTVDLLLAGLFYAGATQEDIASTIAPSTVPSRERDLQPI